MLNQKKCSLCGTLIGLPFRCSHCNKSFCINHKLPENHDCKNFDTKSAIPLWKKL